MRQSASAGLVVGLGNPGRRYAGTRHNVGFSVLQNLVAPPEGRFGVVQRINVYTKAFELFSWEIETESDSWMLCLPLTYMNRSGRAVHSVCTKYRFKPEQLLVIHDDLDLPFGILRFKFDGGLAGHNGLRSVAGEIGSRDFYRLRVGIGRPAPGVEVVDHVLSPFEESEVRSLPDIFFEAARGILIFRREGFHKAVQTLHSRTLK
ncbi:MAG: aminoacyl-tRNA hydrolase [Desulfohalobiaceae bacterium]|nr:aminoacyl-tRNA hydrolase [Desulfohalobiaceae bacterium]